MWLWQGRYKEKGFNPQWDNRKYISIMTKNQAI
jgi:Ca2+-dependent lipid-binding protein